MSRRPNRMQRLVRLKQFREEVADGQLRVAAAAEREAEGARDHAVETMEAIGEWKLRSGAPAIDLGFYQVAIAAEAGAMERADAAGRELGESREAREHAGAALSQAALAHRAARNRSERLRLQALAEQEKREFDQMSELMASARGERS